MDLYIYYKVAPDNASALLPVVCTMQTQLAPVCGAAPQLKCRADAPDGVQTWMEVYPDTLPGFADALTLAVRDAALDTLISGPRHSETFMDMTTCA